MRFQIEIKKSRLVPLLSFFFIFSFPLNAIERGGWLWKSPEREFGSVNVIGNSSKQSQLIKNLKEWKIKRLYVSSTLDEASYGKIAAFNTLLAKEGIQSYFLISDQAWNDPKNFATLTQNLNKTFFKFNQERINKKEKFIGIAFDLEPHIEKEWKSKAPREKAETLIRLADVYKLFRVYLKQSQQKELLLSATLTSWYDSLPKELGGEGTIGWKSSEERDHFFDVLSENLDSLTLMAFEIPKADRLLKQVSVEREKLGKKAIIALRVNLGNEWKTRSEMEAVMNTVEKETGSGIDIQSVERLMEKQY